MSDVAELPARPDIGSREISPPRRKASGAWFPRFFVASALAVVAVGLLWLQARKTEDRWRLPEDLTAFRAISRIEDYLYWKESADCVLLGSSLMQGPAHQMDIVFEGLTVPPKEEDASEAMKTFTRSKHLKKIFEQAGKKYSPVSLSVVSSSVADNAAIVQKLVNFKKTPKLLIVGVGLRDLCSEIHDSPVRTRLGILQPENKWDSDPIAALKAKVELSKSARSLQRHWLEACWQVNVCKSYVAKKLSLLVPLRKKVAWKKSEYARAPRTSMMMQVYARFYKVAKNDNVVAQIAQLRNLVKVATDNGASVIVVLMPVSPDHMTVIPPGLGMLFKNSMKDLQADYPIVVADQFSDADYAEKDFGDSLHMTGAAMDRMFKRLLPVVPAAR